MRKVLAVMGLLITVGLAACGSNEAATAQCKDEQACQQCCKDKGATGNASGTVNGKYGCKCFGGG